MHFLLETSPGDFLDKLTILEIKSERITDPAKLANVRHELELLRRRWHEAGIERESVTLLVAELKTVNGTLWEIEDRIRECEAAKRFDAGFVELARAVYITNDRRAAIKRRLNESLGSTLIEEKSYSDYGGPGA
jgi:hypothetical protein